MSPSLCCNIEHFLFIFRFPKELLNQSGTSKGYLVALSFETHCTIYSFLKTDTGSRNTLFPFTSKNRKFTVLKKSTFMASCLEVNNLPYRRVPAGMTSLPFSRYPLSYLPFSCLETPKVSGVIPLPETEKIFVSVSQRNSSPLLQSLRSTPRPIWSTDIFILHGAPSVGQNLPIASPSHLST